MKKNADRVSGEEGTIRSLYEDTVHFFQEHSLRWEQHLPVDMPAMRKQVLPLLDRVEEDPAF